MKIESGNKGRYGALVVAVLLSACGGSDPEIATANKGCSVAEQKDWLRGYMRDWYFWAGSSPDPEPGLYASVASYFSALLLPGEGSTTNLSRRWSYISDTAAYNQFFDEGKSLGYGLSVNGVELKALFDAGQPLTPLKLRYVEPLSPAAGVLARGDTLISINGKSAAQFIKDDDYSAFSPSTVGQALTLVADRGAGPTTLVLQAANYTLTPVTSVSVLSLPNGSIAGYLSLKDFIPTAESPLGNAFATFAAQGASELILDLRYNGGGRISTSNWLASLVAGVAGSEKVFAHLNYNSRHQNYYPDYKMALTTRAGYSRVVVLTGSRTCSASELVVNGLRPYVNVVTLGDTTCGKPVGFNPRSNCSSTYSAVNFESVNALGAGGYYNGIPANCAAADDFTGPLGVAGEKLTAAALNYLQTGVCPVAFGPSPTARELSVARGAARRTTEPGERQGMSAD
jgi:carboxyl-terminal processing protease